MRTINFLFAAIIALGTSSASFAQWTTSGNDIYNTNFNTSTPGKVGIGMIPIDDGAPSAAPPYYADLKPTLQIFGKSGRTGVYALNLLPVVKITSPTFSNSISFGLEHIYYPSTYEYTYLMTEGRFTIKSSQFLVENQTNFLSTVSIGNAPSLGTGFYTPPSGYNFSVQNNAYVGGKLSIGTTNTPNDFSTVAGGYRLYVAGGVLTEKVKVAVSTTSNWSDYVFNKGYKLLSLGEVEAYVKKNKHLPGVPSAAEVVKDGIDMATMDAKLLEKIEELTLYMIEMKKENLKMKKEIVEMRGLLLKK